MKSIARTLSLLLAGACSPTWAAPLAVVQVKNMRPSELRAAVAAHRADQREEVRREQAAAGRRLTAAELAQLREQVRQLSAQHHGQTAEPQPAERVYPTVPTITPERAHTLPRSQRR